MSIMELEASENPGLIVPGVSQVTHNRLILIHLLPRVWVLNGVYITHEERTAAAALFQNPENHLLDLVRCALGPHAVL